MSRFAIHPDLVIEHLQSLSPRLKAAAADGVFVFSPANILGFTGAPLGPSDRLVCGLLDARGRGVLICPAFEAPDPQSLPACTSVITWLEHEDPYAAVAEAAKRLDLARGTILLDPDTWIGVQRRLAATLPQATLREDPGELVRVRLIKSPREVDAIAAGCRRVGLVYPQIARHLRAGITETQLALAAVAGMGNGAPSGGLPMTQSGPNGATPHALTGQRTLADGDSIVVDYVVTLDGYHGDMTRTLVVGKPSDALRKAYQTVRAAQRAAIDACRPGVTCESLDRIARRVIEAADFGPFFIHRLGHGIGLDCHEAPYLVEGNKTVLTPGMCVTVEPGIYVPGQFGVRIEDCVAITDAGCRVLSDTVPTDLSAGFDA